MTQLRTGPFPGLIPLFCMLMHDRRKSVHGRIFWTVSMLPRKDRAPYCIVQFRRQERDWGPRAVRPDDQQPIGTDALTSPLLS